MILVQLGPWPLDTLSLLLRYFLALMWPNCTGSQMMPYWVSVILVERAFQAAQWLRIHFPSRWGGFSPWIGKIPWRSNGHPLQYSCLVDPMDGGAWWATVHEVAKSQTWLSDWITTILDETGNKFFPWEIQKFRLISTWTLSCLSWNWKSLSRVWLSGTHAWTSPWDSPGQNTGEGSLSLFQVIFPTQGSNPDLLHCRQILYQLRCKGRSPISLNL